jgi:anti-anti-sigma regulatory factor
MIKKQHIIAALAFVAVLTAVLALPTFEIVSGCIRAQVWPTSLLVATVTADALIALAYAWIPLTLIAVWRKRRDVPVSWTLACFAAFIVLCGLTHVMAIVTAFRPLYWLAVEVQLATAAVSLATAYLLQTRVGPILLTLKSYGDVSRSNVQLEKALADVELGKVAAEELAEQLRAAKAEAEAARALAEQREERAKGGEADARDENDQLRRALTELQQAEQTIAAQRLAIGELEAVVVELYEGILYVPIAGPLDSRRAQALQEKILTEIVAKAARLVVIDLTGVTVVDTAVANWILRVNATIRLLGSEAHLVGIGGHVADAIVALGVDLASMQSSRSPRVVLERLIGKRAPR